MVHHLPASYRDLVAIVAERGFAVSHATIMRWVLGYLPEYERRWARFARPTSPSWRMDKTAVSVRGGRYYLYRAVDRNGESVASLLCRDRTMRSAEAFFRRSLAGKRVSWPEKINLDGNIATHLALQELGREDTRWRSVTVRVRRYLNNVIEQDHRAIKQRCASMLSFKFYQTAAITLAGVELAHRIRKQQYFVPLDPRVRGASMKNLWDQALSRAGGPIAQGSSDLPPMHRNSQPPQFQQSNDLQIAPVPYPTKVSTGHRLYMLLLPAGGRYWRYNYRYNGRHKTLALGKEELRQAVIGPECAA